MCVLISPPSHSDIHKKKPSIDILFRLKAINETHHNDPHLIKINLAVIWMVLTVSPFPLSLVLLTYVDIVVAV